MADVQGLYLVTAIVLALLLLWVIWVSWRAPPAVVESLSAVVPAPPEQGGGRGEPSTLGPSHGEEAATSPVPSEPQPTNEPSGVAGPAKDAPMKTMLGLAASVSSTPPPVEVKPVVVLPAKPRLDSHLEIQDSPPSASVVVTPDTETKSEQSPSNALAAAIGRSEPLPGRSPEPHLIDAPQHLFVFADSSGKKVGPKLASAIAVHEVVEAFKKNEGSISPVDPKLTARGNRLRRAVLAANRSLLQQARAAGYAGLGTSLLASHFSPANEEAIVARVGKNRAYRVRGDEITRMTTPHGGRLFGLSDKVEVEVVTETVLPDDVYLFCSEGLGEVLEESELLAILKERESIDRVTQRLVDVATSKAHRPDGDELVALVVRVHREAPTPVRSSRRSKTVMGLG
jgi:PPM family protein phosphatase